MRKVLIVLVLLALVITGLLIRDFNQGIPVAALKEKYLYPESKFVLVDGIEVHYRITGDANKEKLVLMHGVASSLHTWEAWHNYLEKDFQIISFDVPGFGLTGPFADGVYTKEHYMTFLTEFLDKLQIKRAHFAGNSFGGYLAWNYALENPQRVAKLILLDASGMRDTVSHDWRDINIGFLLSTLPLIKDLSWYFTPKAIVKMSVEHVYGDDSKVTDALIERYHAMLLRDGNRRAFSYIIPMIRSDETNAQDLKNVHQPTLILWGAKDKLHTLAEGENLHKAIAHSVLKVYPQLGHVPMEEDPQATVQDAKIFLLQN